MFLEQIETKCNVFITARERGKKVPSQCRQGHNIWVNLGRTYLAERISPAAGGGGTPYNAYYLRYMALGIGGNKQTLDIAAMYPTLDTHYPGLNTYDKDTITTEYLERPVKVSGTAGVGSSDGVWGAAVSTPPSFSGSPLSTVEFMTAFSAADFHLSGAYPSVPLSEAALMLSSQEMSRTSEEVYAYPPNPSPWINTGTRQRLVAYHVFAPITKTSSITLEIRWQIQF